MSASATQGGHKQQCFCPYVLQYAELRPNSGWDPFVSLTLGTPANFNGFRVLAAFLHGTLVVGLSQTLRPWIEGAAYIWQGGHHAHILVMISSQNYREVFDLKYTIMR